jgi:sugar phosphate isomerase/epimerase
MADNGIKLSIFTKPWRTETIEELGGLVAGLGFDGVEFPLRPGYQVDPKDAVRGLPALVARLGAFGVKVFSVASSTDEAIFAGCQAAGVPVIRIMADVDQEIGYMASEERWKRELEAVVPLCEKYGVTVGVQMHCGWCAKDAMQLLHLVGSFDPRHVGAIWDAGHAGLAGEAPEMGLDIAWSHLCMVNLKNAYYVRSNGPEAAEAEWDVHWTTGTHGLGSWRRTADYLKKRGYEGVVCLTNEYSDEANTKKYMAVDAPYARSLLR